MTFDEAQNPPPVPVGCQANPVNEEHQIGVEAKRRKLQMGLLMLALCMSVFLAALDITIVTTALPTISQHFHSVSGYIWVGSAFQLAAAASTPNWGKFSDIWGRKCVLLTAAAVFFLGSTLCGTAVNIAMIIAGRGVQGVGAGGLLTLVNIIIGDLFSQRERGKYYGIIGMVWATASALGPVIGGALTYHVSWRWCFYINLPISGFAFVVILLVLRLPASKASVMDGVKIVDWFGSVTLTGGVVMFLLGLQFGGTEYPWASVKVICLIVFGIVILGVFVEVEVYLAQYPIIPPHLFINWSNVAIIVVDFFHGTVFTQGAYFLPFYFQSVLGAKPLLSGVWLLPFVLSLSLGAVGTGIYIKKTGRYLDCIRLGFALSVLGFGLLYDLPQSKMWSKIIIYQLIAGLGVGLNFQPPLVALQSNVSPQDNATATATFSLVRNAASAIGVVVGSVVFSGKMTAQQDVLRGVLGDKTAFLLSGARAQANVFLSDALHGNQRETVRHAFYVSLRMLWLETVCLAAAGLISCIFIQQKTLDETQVEIRTGVEGEKERGKIVAEQRMRRKQPAGESQP